MGRPELGTKCTCTGCHERFYDLNRLPAVCPKCGVQQPLEQPRAARPSRSSFGTALRPRQLAAAAAATDDDVEPAVESEDEAETEVLDADDEAEVDEDAEIDPNHLKPAD